MHDQPPSYDQAVGSSSKPQTLNVPGNGGISPAHRRSMEDEGRPLPSGWIRQYDAKAKHQYFVDTNVDPPRSTWTHPYEDPIYLKSITTAERERIRTEHYPQPSHADIIADESDLEHPDGQPGSSDTKGSSKWGRKLKDKMTGTTHEQREQERRRREKEDQETYRRHTQIRNAMALALETGQPQLIGKDKEGNDVYIEPPHGGPYGGPSGGGGYGGGGGSRYVNPYASGPYSQPNARFIPYPVPSGPYGRPYGPGYGMGMGFPLMGGLMGGAMLGGLMF